MMTVHQIGTTGERSGGRDRAGRQVAVRGGLARRLSGSGLAEAFLLAAVGTVLAIRGFLAATGYPSVGGSTLHVAHMLWGGLGMLAALLALLLFVGSRVRLAAVWIGGLGFGFFIDEIGKFLTRDNDYFFRPAVALIYAVFIAVFLLVRALSRRRLPSRAERLANAYSALTDVALGTLDDRRRQQALALLVDDDPVVDHVRALLAGAPAPTRSPSRWAHLTGLTWALGHRLHAFAAAPRMRRASIGLFLLLAVGLVAGVVVAFVRRGDVTAPLNVVTVGSGLTVLAITVCSVLGIGQLIRGARAAALDLLYSAALVSLLFGQFFAFIALQFLALVGLAVNLLVLVALRVEMAVEADRDGGRPGPRRPPVVDQVDPPRARQAHGSTLSTTSGEPVPGAFPGVPPPPAGSAVVDWITGSTRVGRTITAAIPPDYARYATVVIPSDDAAKTLADAALVEVLEAHTPVQPWRLGYLDTGVADLVDPEAPRVAVYVGWPYALLEGDPEQALTARRNADATPWHSALPELVFPRDRSWLVSTMWDDDWRCVGGPAALVDSLLLRPELTARVVTPDEDATPPGHTAD